MSPILKNAIDMNSLKPTLFPEYVIKERIRTLEEEAFMRLCGTLAIELLDDAIMVSEVAKYGVREGVRGIHKHTGASILVTAGEWSLVFSALFMLAPESIQRDYSL